MSAFFFLSVLFLLAAGCAHRTDAFHDKDLPDALKPNKNALTVGASSPASPYKALSWRAD